MRVGGVPHFQRCFGGQVTDEVVRWHLSGFDAQQQPFVMGVYPLLLDEMCWFPAVYFDGDDWKADASA